ncbi:MULTISPECIES: hypothetical protein [Trichocoleus]|uniref:Uncharacterized protein n=1 Tax=Trichocoleus desertorum GB2-A4 TaxID=2933944 RepID=A0ABV0JIX9_9CYAN|nr:hypothetical protein [Trichocoleus sp. FACHB-46]MBD1865070.1 hypothetical protein [Trichocoleus sp. FACHB-46]
MTPPPGEDLTTSELYDLIRAFGYPLERVSYAEWRTRLLEPAPSNPLYPLLPLLTEQVHENQTLIELYQHCPDYDCSNTQQGLVGTSIAFSSIRCRIVETYLPYFVQSGFLDGPCGG